MARELLRSGGLNENAVQAESSQVKRMRKLVSLLLKENIKLDNLSYKKDKLNNIVATYLQENTINDKEKPELIQVILNKLPK